jgi:rsbT co-antagonist protein RsbR
MNSILSELLRKNEQEILFGWLKLQLAAATLRADLMAESELRQQSREFLSAFQDGLSAGDFSETSGLAWSPARAIIESISHSRAQQGYSYSETATFVFSLKQPIYTILQKEITNNSAVLVQEIWTVTTLLDSLGLFSTEAFLKGKEELIRRQQDEMLELSTPVVKLWDKILALPLIGTLDSSRTQVVMESLLQEIVDTESSVAIIDITGVPTVDTLVAQHLIKTVSAARLMGAECIISGIRPQIAQSMVHLGVAFSDITTKATLADALKQALKQTGYRIARSEQA